MKRSINFTLDNLIYSAVSKGKDTIEIVLPKKLPTASTVNKPKSSVSIIPAVQIQLKLYLRVYKDAQPDIKILGENKANIFYSSVFSIESGNTNLITFTTTDGGANWLIDCVIYSDNPIIPTPGGGEVNSVNGLKGNVIVDGTNIHLKGNSGPTIYDSLSKLEEDMSNLETTIVNDVSNEIVKVLPDMIKTQIEGAEIIAEKI